MLSLASTISFEWVLNQCTQFHLNPLPREVKGENKHPCSTLPTRLTDLVSQIAGNYYFNNSLPTAMNTLPFEVLQSIIGLLSPRDMECLSLTSKLFWNIFSNYVIPFKPIMHSEPKAGVIASKNGLMFQRASQAGNGILIGSERIDSITCYWEIKLTQSLHSNIEIGVCVLNPYSESQGFERKKMWTIDCLGRAKHDDKIAAYGEVVPQGSVIGVLHDKKREALAFFSNGLSMGYAHRSVKTKQKGSGLFPMVILPSEFCGKVEIKFPEFLPNPSPLPSLLVTRRQWHSRIASKFLRIHRHLLIKSFDQSRCYKLDFPGYETTLQELKQILLNSEQLRNFTIEANNLLLCSQGKVLINNNYTLEDIGIKFGKNGAQLQDLFVYV